MAPFSIGSSRERRRSVGKRLVAWLVGMLVFLASATAWASITQVVTSPLDGDPAGDTLNVGTKVTSSFAITKVTVTILGVSTPVTLRGGGPPVYYQSEVPLDAFPEGNLLATIVAENAGGESVTTTRAIVHDKPPIITVASPTRWTFRSSATPIRLKVTCSDTALYPCAQMDIPTLGVVAGSAFDADIVPPVTARDLSVTVWDTLGLASTVKIPLAYDPTPTLSILHTVPGRVLDVDDTRILFTNPAGMWVRTLATGADARVGDDVGDAGKGELALSGAVAGEGMVSANRRFVVTSTAGWRPTSLDLLTGVSTTCPSTGKPYTSVGKMVGVSDEGWPAWLASGGSEAAWHCATTAAGSYPHPSAVIWAPGHCDATAHVHDAVLSGRKYVFSGFDINYTGLNSIAWNDLRPGAPCGAGQGQGVLAPYVAEKDVPLSRRGSERRSGRARLNFDTRCDWIGFTKLVGTDILAFIRSPSGVVTQRGIWSGENTLGGIAPNGEMIVLGGAGLNVTRDGAPPALFSTTTARARWAGGRWLALAGNAVLESSASPPGGPLDCPGTTPGGPDAGAPDGGGGAAATDGGASDGAVSDAGASSSGSSGPGASSSGSSGPGASSSASSSSGSSSGASGSGSSSSGSSSGGGAPPDGGCSAGSGPPGATLGGPLFFALVFLRRARRARREKEPRATSRS